MLVVCSASGNWQQSSAERHSPEQVSPVGLTPKLSRSQIPVAIQTRPLSQSLFTRQASPRELSCGPALLEAPASPEIGAVQRVLKQSRPCLQSRRDVQL